MRIGKLRFPPIITRICLLSAIGYLACPLPSPATDPGIFIDCPGICSQDVDWGTPDGFYWLTPAQAKEYVANSNDHVCCWSHWFEPVCRWNRRRVRHSKNYHPKPLPNKCRWTDEQDNGGRP